MCEDLTKQLSSQSAAPVPAPGVARFREITGAWWGVSGVHHQLVRVGSDWLSFLEDMYLPTEVFEFHLSFAAHLHFPSEIWTLWGLSIETKSHLLQCQGSHFTAAPGVVLMSNVEQDEMKAFLIRTETMTHLSLGSQSPGDSKF